MIATAALWIAGKLIARRPSLTPARAGFLAKAILAAGFVLLLIGAVIAFRWWLSDYAQDAVEADRASDSAATVERAREADERAHEAATGTVEAVERENEQARQVAEESDDPLADGLRWLRGE